MKKWILPLFIGTLLLLLSACSLLPTAGGKGDAGDEAQAGDGQTGGNGDDGKADGGQEEEWGLDLSIPDESVPYGIYVGANVSGHCDPYKNNGGFEKMTFDSVFHKIVFVRPGAKTSITKYGGMYKAGGEGNFPMIGIGIPGEGELGDFTLCPQYEDEKGCACHVTNGPNPFEPSLSLMPPEDDMGLVPMVGTPAPNTLGTALLYFSIGGTKDLSPIMEWEGCVGSGALGGSLEPVDVYFVVTWDQLLAGEEFAEGAITDDEGETWEWSIRFMPGY
ncbi:MAG: hypothetical protein WBM17_11610 [Anaerolineales bacterium]